MVNICTTRFNTKDYIIPLVCVHAARDSYNKQLSALTGISNAHSLCLCEARTKFLYIVQLSSGFQRV